MGFRSFSRFWMVAALVVAAAGAAGCDNSAEKLAQKEKELAEKDRQLQEQKLAERERALKEREEGASARDDSAGKNEKAAEREDSPADSKPAAPARPSGPRWVAITASITVAMAKPAGGAWDVGGGGPDPLVTARTGSGSSNTWSFNDQQTVNVSWTVQLQQSDTVTFTAVDKDMMSASDPIGSYTAKYNGRSGTVTGNMGAASISVTFKDKGVD